LQKLSHSNRTFPVSYMTLKNTVYNARKQFRAITLFAKLLSHYNDNGYRFKLSVASVKAEYYIVFVIGIVLNGFRDLWVI